MRHHVYIGWAVTLSNGNVVNFQDQREALRYFGERDATEMRMTRSTIPCGLYRRSFCGHCTDGVPVIDQ
jgi:hypothetical protein